MKIIIIKCNRNEKDEIVQINGFGHNTEKAVDELYKLLLNDISSATFDKIILKLRQSRHIREI